jgi:heat shock protein HspQ
MTCDIIGLKAYIEGSSNMTNDKNEFVLPLASVNVMNSIIHSYVLCSKFKAGVKVPVNEVAAKCSLGRTAVSRHHAFLMCMGILNSGRDKSLTTDGVNLGVAIGNSDGDSERWREILMKSDTIHNILDAIRIKGQFAEEEFSRKIATMLSLTISEQKFKSGISHLIEFMEYAGVVIKRDNSYFLGNCAKNTVPKNEKSTSVDDEDWVEVKEKEEEASTPAPVVTSQLTANLPNIHIDLQIHISPESTPEQVDAIFKSIKTHLYS